MGDPAEDDYTRTRVGLQRVATHIIARRRFAISGRFGLRASPGGIAAPAFGPPPESLRTAGLSLVREVAGDAVHAPMHGATLRELAAFGGVDLETVFSVGAGTPAMGDPDAALGFDADAMRIISDWYALGWHVLDTVVGRLGASAAVATTQLWPEHMDAATNVGLASGVRANLGFSPGDGFEAGPYLYLGPWGAQRPGDPSFWNAPFGAVLPRDTIVASPDPAAACDDFFRTGLELLASAPA